jgi:hypothetical protein
MAIVLVCPNGHKLAVADEHAGKKAICTICKAIMPIPAAPAAPRAVSAAAAPPPPVRTGPPENPPPVRTPPPVAPPPQPVTDIRLAEPGPAPPSPEPPAMQVTEFVEPEPMLITDIAPGPGTPNLVPLGQDEEPFEVIEDFEEVRPRPSRARERERKRTKKKARLRRQGLNLVNLGLGFHFARFVVFQFCLLLYVGIVVTAIPNPSMASVLAIFFNIGFFLVAPLLGITGSILCLWVPGDSNARVFIIISLALDGVIPFFWIILIAAALAAGTGGALAVVLLGFLAFIGAWVMFMIFLKFLAEYLDQVHLGNESVRLIIKGIIILVTTMVVQAILFAMAFNMPLLLVGLIALALFIGWVVVMVNFITELLNLIGSIRQVIASRW